MSARFVATTVPAILILGGIVILIMSPLGLNPLWGWALIILGVALYLLDYVFDSD